MRRFARAKRGAAAVEFALLAPVMVFTLFGLVESIELLDAFQSAERSAASSADVISRFDELEGQDVCDVLDSIPLLTPLLVDRTVRITSINIANTTEAEATVGWSEARGVITPMTPGEDVTASLPADVRLSARGASLIQAEVAGVHAPTLMMIFEPRIAISRSELRRPRLVDRIPLLSGCPT